MGMVAWKEEKDRQDKVFVLRAFQWDDGPNAINNTKPNIPLHSFLTFRLSV